MDYIPKRENKASKTLHLFLNLPSRSLSLISLVLLPSLSIVMDPLMPLLLGHGPPYANHVQATNPLIDLVADKNRIIAGNIPCFIPFPSLAALSNIPITTNNVAISNLAPLLPSPNSSSLLPSPTLALPSTMPSSSNLPLSLHSPNHIYLKWVSHLLGSFLGNGIGKWIRLLMIYNTPKHVSSVQGNFVRIKRGEKSLEQGLQLDKEFK